MFTIVGKQIQQPLLCRTWFEGRRLADGSHEEWSEDCISPLRDLTKPCQSEEFPAHAYDMEDIDNISRELGIP